MADIRLAKPAAGTSQNIVCIPDARFVFEFSTDEATLSRNGDNLVITFEDGSTLQLENFYTAYSSENMPSFSVDGAEISGEDFFTAMNEPDLMPAAGPAGNAGNQSNGNRFHDYVNADLLDGLDRLGGLDIGWGDGDVFPDIDGAGAGGDINYPVTVTPGDPGAESERLTVYESGLADGSAAGQTPTTAEGSLRISTPDGVVSIVIDGVTVFANGMLTGNLVSTDEGVLTVTGFNAATGELRFVYELNGNTLEHTGSGRDAVYHDLTVTVTDTDGDIGTGLISVVIEDDVPLVSEPTLEGGGVVAGNNEVSVSFGADNDTEADSPLAVNAYDSEGKTITWITGNATGNDNLNDLAEGESWTSPDGNIIVSRGEDGSFVFKIKENGESADITVTATDADGDTDSKTLHLTIPGVGSNDIIVDEALLSDGSGDAAPDGQGGHGDGHAASGSGSFTVDLHGEDGVVTLTYGEGEDASTVTLNLKQGQTTVTLSQNNVFTVNGVTVTVTGAEQQSDGSWKINYTYALNGEQTHGKPSTVGANDVLSGTISIEVKDATGDITTGSLQVTVHDDGPVLTGLSNSTDADAMLNESTGPFVVALDDFHIGADMVGTTPAEVAEVTVEVGGQTYTFTVSGSPDAYEFTPGEGQGNAVSIEPGENGYELHYTRPGGDKDDPSVKEYTFTVTVTDADGDSVIKNITLTTKDKPDISFGTGEGSVKEAGVAGCDVPAESTDPNAPNAEVSGVSSVEGSITLTDTDSDALTLTVNGSVQHADGHASGLPMPSLTTWNGALTVGGSGETAGGDTLTLYLNEDGVLVTATELEEGEDYYGTLTLDFSAGKEEGSWDFTLNEGSALVDSLKEGESFDITLNLTATDADKYSSSGNLTIHIQGTNDKPVFTTAANSVGDIVVTDWKNDGETGSGVEGVSSTVSGTLTATDADADNGAGSDEADKNGLTFTVTGLTSSDAGTVDANGYDSYGPGFNYNNLVSSQIKVTSGSDNDGNFTQVTTSYGTLKVYADGSYTYTPTDTSKIGRDEYVTETFTVKVQDKHGSWSEQNITITLRDEDNGITGGADISQNLREEGVVGDDKSLGYPGTDPNKHVPTQNGTPTDAEGENNVLFTDADVNDTVTLTIDGTSSVGSIASASNVTVGIVGSSSTVLYLVAAENSDGTWSFSWSTELTVHDDVVGKLELYRESGDVAYNFTLDPNNKNNSTATDNSRFLDQLDQGDEVEIKLDFTAGVATSQVELTITGTNDRPTVSVKPDATVIYGSGVGREQDNDADDEDDAVSTNGENILNSDENDAYGPDSPLTGTVSGDDADAGDSTTFFIASAGEKTNTGKLTCTVDGAKDTLTVMLDGKVAGTLELNSATGEYTFELNKAGNNPLTKYAEGSSFSFTVNFGSMDSHGSTSATNASVTITIVATNDAPVISAAQNLSINESGSIVDENGDIVAGSGASVSGKVTATDADTAAAGGAHADTLTYGLLVQDAYGNPVQNADGTLTMTDSVTIEGWGTLKINSATGDYTFYLDTESDLATALRDGEKHYLTFHVVVRDDKGAYDTQQITVTINGEDTATVFVGNAAVGFVKEEGVVPDGTGNGNNTVSGTPSAFGRVEAQEFDHGTDGEPLPVKYSVKAGGEVKGFGELDDAVSAAINGKFTDAAWSTDADVTVVQGAYGTLYLNNETGQYFYQLNNDKDATDALRQGQTAYDDFTIHAVDSGDKNGADQPLKIAVQGTNDAPVVTGVELGDASEAAGFVVNDSDDGKSFTVSGIQEDGAVQTVSGTVTATDVDSPDGSADGEASVLRYLIKVTDAQGNVSYRSAADGEYGYLTIDEETGEYTFELDNEAAQKLDAGDKESVSFTIVVKDEYGAVSEEKELVFNIEGTADTATVNDVPLRTDEDNTDVVSGTNHIVISDVDAGVKEFTSVSTAGGTTVSLSPENAAGTDSEGHKYWTITGDYGTLKLTENGDGTLSYSYELKEEGREALQRLNKDDTVKEQFTVTGTSGTGEEQETVSGTITVNIKGENDAPYDLTLKQPTVEDPNHQVDLDGHSIKVENWDSVGGTVVGHDIDNTGDELRYFVDNEVADPDEEQNASTLQTVKGEYGYLTINSETGEFSYTVDTLSDAYQALENSTQPGRESFTIIVADPYGKTHEETIHFDVFYHDGTGGGQAPGLDDVQPVEVDEDGGEYFETDDNGDPVLDAEGNPIDLTPPPSVESEWTGLVDKNGDPVEVDPSNIWLVTDKGTGGEARTHVVNTEYGSLILEQNEDGEWGYRFVLDNSSDAVQALDEGDKIELTFDVQTSAMNGTTVPIKVTVTGLNDRPVIESSENLVVNDVDNAGTDDKENFDGGRLSTSDADAEDVGSTEGTSNLSYSVAMATDGYTLTQVEGTNQYTVTGTWKGQEITWGTFTLNQDGSYSFTASDDASILLKGENPNFELTITVNDGSNRKEDGTELTPDDEGYVPNATASTDITVTIQGTNEAPEIGLTDTTLTVREDAALTASNNLNVTDDRQDASGKAEGLTYSVAAGDGDGASTGTFAAGNYGSLYVKSDGTYTYRLNNQLQAVQELTGKKGDTLTDTFTIHVKDKDGAEVLKEVTVTIKGTNDEPVFTLFDPVLTVQEGAAGTSVVTGNALATDVDKGDEDNLSYTFVARNDSGNFVETGTPGTDEDGNAIRVVETAYGTFEINTETGKYTFTLDNGLDAVKNLRPTDMVEVSTTVQVSDGRGGTTEQELTVQITGSETAPEVTVGESIKPNWEDTAGTEASGWSGEVFTGKIEATGWDAGPDGSHTDTLSYALAGSHPETVGGVVWRVLEGDYGTLYLNPATGEYRYEPSGNAETLAAGESWPDDFTVTITDSAGNSITEDFTVTITGTNQNPTIASNTVSGNTGTLTFSDIDANDTHTVTFDNLYTSKEGAGQGGEALSVDTDALPESSVAVYDAAGNLIGSMSFTYAQGTGNQGNKLSYVFTPNEAYENSLAVGESASVSLDVTVTDSANGSVSLDSDKSFTITNENDAPVIDDALSGVTDNNGDGVYEGTLTFSDADAKDTHTVTFNGLKDVDGNNLTVNTGTLTGETTLDVYVGTVKVGELTVSYAQGAGNQGNELSYTFTPDGAYTDSLNRGQSVELDFTVQVSDAGGKNDSTEEETFTVTGTNEEPTLGTPSSGVNTGSVAVSDAESNNVTLTLTLAGAAITLQDGGTGTLDGVTFTYENGTLSYAVSPDRTDAMAPGAEESLAFDVTLDDGHGTVGTTLTLPVTSTNENPVIDGHQWTSFDDNVLAGELFDVSDDSNDNLIFSLGDGPQFGSVTVNEDDGSFSNTYTPGANADGAPTDSFTVQVSDEHGGLTEHEVTVRFDDQTLTGTEGADTIFGGYGDDTLYGDNGDDYLFGGSGNDYLDGGDGNDIVVYDGNDYLIDGGSGIDFIVSNDDSLSLNKLLTESGRNGNGGPLVNGVEVLIKGEDALSLTSMDQLSRDYGITIDRDAQGNETLTLDSNQWKANDNGGFDYVGPQDADLNLETSLTPVTHDDAADAVQQQVFILQNTQG